ncbi:hypothetical protein Sjap_010535 [Stephania japonica]|uniref:OVATE domain-containing protein n=1 Tax=Stephania japonica TaxID=461633 RepID=A0AAP0J9S5_9MAGN
MKKRGCDGDGRQRWRSEAASNGGVQTTEREKKARDFEMRERGHEEEKRKSPKVSHGGKEMDKTFNIYKVAGNLGIRIRNESFVSRVAIVQCFVSKVLGPALEGQNVGTRGHECVTTLSDRVTPSTGWMGSSPFPVIAVPSLVSMPGKISRGGEQALSQFHPNPSSAIALVLSKAQCLFSEGVRTISSLAHAMVQDRLDQMIRERFVQSRNEGGRRESERYGDGNSDDTKCIVMVAMDKYSYDPRKDFRDSMVEMITANQIEDPKDLRVLLYSGLAAHVMNIELGHDDQHDHPRPQQPKKTPTFNWPLLLLSILLIVTGVVGGPLLVRFYYLNGGKRKWLPSFLQTCGFPILIFPILFLSLRHNTKTTPTPTRTKTSMSHLFTLEPTLFFYSAVNGLLIGLDNYLYSIGLSYLPVSTSTLLQSTQVAFVAVFSLLLVRQRFTPYSINSVVLMTLGSVMLGMRSQGDRPSGVSQKEYVVGFFMTLLSAALIGVVFPLVEFSYGKAVRPINYSVLLMYQFNQSVFGTIFSVVGMAVNKDFQIMGREANEFARGKAAYSLTLAGVAVFSQLGFLGILGVISSASSLFAGILTAVLVPIIEIASFVAYHESFTREKGMSLALCLWGFCSYFYGEYKTRKVMLRSSSSS